jgi:hypothetical protein
LTQDRPTQELADWCRRERDAALRQIDFFTAQGVRALLQPPDGAPQDITDRVLAHQEEVAAMMERIAAALG